jgi:hypothetical protein
MSTSARVSVSEPADSTLYDDLVGRSRVRPRPRLRSVLATSIFIVGVGTTIVWTAFLGWNGIRLLLWLMDILLFCC